MAQSAQQRRLFSLLLHVGTIYILRVWVEVRGWHFHAVVNGLRAWYLQYLLPPQRTLSAAGRDDVKRQRLRESISVNGNPSGSNWGDGCVSASRQNPSLSLHSHMHMYTHTHSQTHTNSLCMQMCNESLSASLSRHLFTMRHEKLTFEIIGEIFRGL